MKWIKDAVRAVLLRFGWELNRVNVPLSPPPWIVRAEPRSLEDEVIKEGWVYNVLCMANRYYSPPSLAFSGAGTEKIAA
jgi:hypothetical protein